MSSIRVFTATSVAFDSNEDVIELICSFTGGNKFTMNVYLLSTSDGSELFYCISSRSKSLGDWDEHFRVHLHKVSDIVVELVTKCNGKTFDWCYFYGPFSGHFTHS
jgi:hypothetical protein